MTTPFQHAVEAITTGDEPTLSALLLAHPDLAQERAPFPHQATLLHYIGANGVEVQRSFSNSPVLARMLLAAGADPDATAPIYSGDDTPLGLTVTSVHPYLAGVQAELVDVLLDHGAKIEGLTGQGDPLGAALLFGYTGAAERLASRGARIANIVYAAGLGRVDLLRDMLESGAGTNILRRADDRAGRYSFPIPRDADGREVALIVAAMHGRVSSVRMLLDAGVDVKATPFCRQSALHFAAQMGRAEVVDELLARGAHPNLPDSQMNRTPAQWARESGHVAIAELLECR
jgi:ankyrin repeat protein